MCTMVLRKEAAGKEKKKKEKKRKARGAEKTIFYSFENKGSKTWGKPGKEKRRRKAHAEGGEKDGVLIVKGKKRGRAAEKKKYASHPDRAGKKEKKKEGGKEGGNT